MFTVLPLIRILCSRWCLILTCQQETRCSCSARGLPPFRSCPRTHSATSSVRRAAWSRTSAPSPAPPDTPCLPCPARGRCASRKLPSLQSPPGLCGEGRRASSLSQSLSRGLRVQLCVRALRQAVGVRSGQALSSACDLLSGSSSSAGRSYGGGALSKRVLRGSCWKLFLSERGAAFSDLHPGS